MIKQRTSQARRIALLSALTLTSALGLAQSAQAVTEPITTGSATWGVRESFRDYVGGFAGGNLSVGDGATCTPLSSGSPYCASAPFTFPVTSGEFDYSTQNLDIALGGWVRFYGHGGSLNLTISDLHIFLRDGASVIRADINDVPMDGGEPAFHDNVNMAAIDLSGKTPAIGSGITTWSVLPTILTSAGAPAFGGIYLAGEGLDPITFSYTGPGGIPGSGPVDPPDDLAITTSPTPQSITVGSRTEAGEVTFLSAAEGTPYASPQWQKRPLGDLEWEDIPGEADPDLTFQATAADNNTSYRALYTNGTDSLPTSSAKLTVTVNDVIAPELTLIAPQSGSSTTDSSTRISYTITDNDDPRPLCSIADGAFFPLAIGANTIEVICVDDFGNIASRSASVTRNALPIVPPAVPAPAAPKLKSSSKSVKLKSKGGKSAKVSVGTVTCASSSTCIYKLPKSIKIKIGKKRYSARVSGPESLEPGASQRISVTVRASAIKALKGKKAKISVTIQVSNSAGVKHDTAKNAVANIRA